MAGNETEVARRVAVMTAAVRELCEKCEAAGVPGPVLAEHLFDASRTALTAFGGKRVMADCCRRLAAAYDEAADREEAASRH